MRIIYYLEKRWCRFCRLPQMPPSFRFYEKRKPLPGLCYIGWQHGPPAPSAIRLCHRAMLVSAVWRRSSHVIFIHQAEILAGWQRRYQDQDSLASEGQKWFSSDTYVVWKGSRLHSSVCEAFWKWRVLPRGVNRSKKTDMRKSLSPIPISVRQTIFSSAIRGQHAGNNL